MTLMVAMIVNNKNLLKIVAVYRIISKLDNDINDTCISGRTSKNAVVVVITVHINTKK